jgi:hypothetical protein
MENVIRIAWKTPHVKSRLPHKQWTLTPPRSMLFCRRPRALNLPDLCPVWQVLITTLVHR